MVSLYHISSITCPIQREECRLTIFEKRELMRIFGPKRDEITGEWRRLRWAGHVARMGREDVHTGL